MKTFVIYTTSGEKWEMRGGIYIVNAYSELDAAGLWLEQPKNNVYPNETIKRIEEINTSKQLVLTIQIPSVE